MKSNLLWATSRGVGVESDIRLQKFLSMCGVASRRHAEELIRAGIVEVNGKVVTRMGLKINPIRDRVSVRQKEVRPQSLGVLIFNKPRSVLTTMNDPMGRRTIAEFMPPEAMGYFPVGRLDYNSSGLVIMSNDGELASRLTHPRYESERVYEVKVVGHPPQESLQKLSAGVKLEDGVAKAFIKILRSDETCSWLRVTIFEGRNRIIRRMMDAIGHPVKKLHRVSHGPFKLGGLASGEFRAVSEQEYLRMREIVFGESELIQDSNSVH